MVLQITHFSTRINWHCFFRKAANEVLIFFTKLETGYISLLILHSEFVVQTALLLLLHFHKKFSFLSGETLDTLESNF